MPQKVRHTDRDDRISVLCGKKRGKPQGSRTLPALQGGVYNLVEMVELTQLQMVTMERLFEAGFRPIAIAPYENALCVHRGECAALLAPVENGGLRLLAPATLMVDGNLSVRLKRATGDVFVWKKKEVAATEERLKELEAFREELVGILEMTGRA